MTATYTCQKCNMAVNATCANCSNEPLVNDSLDNNGTTNNTISWTPTATGTFYYQCSLHGGMVGTITVQ